MTSTRTTKRGDLHMTLVILGRVSLMPELLDYFDYDCEKFLDFIHRFGGMTIEVPHPKDLDKLVRDTHIYLTIKDLSGVNRAFKVNILAQHYKLSPNAITEIFDRTSRQIEEEDLLYGKS